MNNYPGYYPQQTSVAAQSSLIQRVSYLLATCLLCTAGSAWWASSAGLSPGLFIPLVIGTFVCVFGINMTRRNPAVSLMLLYGLSVLEGLLLGPMLGAIAHGFPYGAVIIEEAAGLSAIIVAGLGSYVWISGRDFGGIGKFLMIALIGLIVVGFVRFFVHMSVGANLLYSVIGAAIFVGFTLYDFSNIKLRYGPNDYVIATVQLYLDFLNLFIFLLQILMSLSGGGGSRRNS